MPIGNLMRNYPISYTYFLFNDISMVCELLNELFTFPIYFATQVVPDLGSEKSFHTSLYVPSLFFSDPNKTFKGAWCQWLMAVILTTQEAESGGSWFEASGSK
jgi:hypothetical protein